MKIRKTLLFATASVGLIASMLTMSSCKKSDQEKNWEEYAEWREANDAWLREMTINGGYSRVVPDWNRDIHVLMRWENDTTLTSGNLRPLYTSTVSVKYKGWLYDGTPFDSSYAFTDSLTSLKPSGLVDGWIAALEQMHVGDKVELIVPYAAGYGGNAYGNVPPYSNLRFKIELRDIPYYELKDED